MEIVFTKVVECECIGIGKVISGKKNGQEYRFCKAYFTYEDINVEGSCSFETSFNLLNYPELNYDLNYQFLLIFKDYKLVNVRFLGYC